MRRWFNAVVSGGVDEPEFQDLLQAVAPCLGRERCLRGDLRIALEFGRPRERFA